MTEAGGRIDAIEGLRALAVGLVIFQHAGNLAHGVPSLGPLVASGALSSGVDLFFVISGFVIARGLLPALDAARGRGRARLLAGFWLRRAFRLWPAAWAVLLINLAASAVLPPDVLGSAAANTGALLAGLFHYANFRFVALWSKGFYGASYQYWSLSVEEQFYLVMPLLALLPRRLFVSICVLAALAELWPGGAVLSLSGHATLSPIYFFTFSIFRVGTMFAGVCLAMAERSFGHSGAWTWPRRLPPLARLALGALCLAAMLRAKIHPPFAETPHGLVALAACAMVWLAATAPGPGLPHSKRWRALLWAGSRSYALYLVHVSVWLCLIAIAQRLPGGAAGLSLPQRIAFLATGLAASALLADLCYRLIETPMRARGRRLADRLTA